MAVKVIKRSVRCGHKLVKKGKEITCGRFLCEVGYDTATGQFQYIMLTCHNCGQRHLVTVQGFGEMVIRLIEGDSETDETKEKKNA